MNPLPEVAMLDKREELKKLRAFLDEKIPDWRTSPLENGQPPNRIDFHLEMKDGTELDLVLYQRPERVPEDDGA